MDLGNLAGNALSMLGGQLADAIAGGGQLVKAQLVLLQEDKSKGKFVTDTLEFPINPESVTIKASTANTARTPNLASLVGSKQGDPQEPREISFSVVFDTYEARKDVRSEYVDKLVSFSRINHELHTCPTLHFVWGNLSADKNIMFPADIEEFEVKYTMFLPDGTPVRCNVDLVLREVTKPEEEGKQHQSPDHAKLHQVKRGDTLQNIAYREYDTPTEWRRIADANGIDDPLDLRPGTRLLVPPILK